MSVKSEGVADRGVNIIYTAPINNVPDIFNMVSDNQGVPELVNILCNDDTLSGLYNVVPVTQHPMEVSNEPRYQEAEDLLNAMSSEEAQQILNVVTHESDLYNIVNDPQDVSEIYIGSVPYDSYNSHETSEIYTIPTPQIAPKAYTQVISQDPKPVISSIDPQPIPIGSKFLEISAEPKLKSTRTKRTPKPKAKQTDKPRKTRKPRAAATKAKKPKLVVKDIDIDPDTAKSDIIELHNGKRLLIVNDYPYYFRHILKTSPLNRWCCNKNSCNAYVHTTLDDNVVVSCGGETHKHLPPKFKRQADGKYIKV